MNSEFAPPSFVSVHGRRLAYDEVGPPDPKGTVLLLTGLGSKRLDWSRQMESFGQRYRAIALDHRDTGDSDAYDGPYTVTDLADDAAGLLDTIGVACAHIVGETGMLRRISLGPRPPARSCSTWP